MNLLLQLLDLLEGYAEDGRLNPGSKRAGDHQPKRRFGQQEPHSNKPQKKFALELQQLLLESNYVKNLSVKLKNDDRDHVDISQHGIILEINQSDGGDFIENGQLYITDIGSNEPKVRYYSDISKRQDTAWYYHENDHSEHQGGGMEWWTEHLLKQIIGLRLKHELNELFEHANDHKLKSKGRDFDLVAEANLDDDESYVFITDLVSESRTYSFKWDLHKQAFVLTMVGGTDIPHSWSKGNPYDDNSPVHTDNEWSLDDRDIGKSFKQIENVVEFIEKRLGLA